MRARRLLESKRITSGRAQIKRATTAIRAAVAGREAFMRTRGDKIAFKAVFSDSEVSTLRAAAKILDKLHLRRGREAKAAAAEEKAFQEREKAARQEAEKIFDGWALDVAGWLPLVIYNQGGLFALPQLAQDGTIAGGWERSCDYTRDCFLDQVAWEAAIVKSGVVARMTARRKKLEKLAARSDYQDFDVLVQQVTAALAGQK